MTKAKTYFRILIDDSPAEDFTSIDEALWAFRDPEYAPIRNKSLVRGHWQGEGEWENFVIDSILL